MIVLKETKEWLKYTQVYSEHLERCLLFFNRTEEIQRLTPFCVQGEGQHAFPAHPYVEKFGKMLGYPNILVYPKIQSRKQVALAFLFLILTRA